MSASEISSCRISRSENLYPILSLGNLALTGVFPVEGELVERGPLDLVWCPDSGLVQLRHSFVPEKMYGDNYGYRSGLNPTMVRHLTSKADKLAGVSGLGPGDVVVDIGSNDGTLLNHLTKRNLSLYGFDPTGQKFRSYYSEEVVLVPDFFSSELFREVSSKQARLVTSIAMFYDLEDPRAFVRQVREVLAPNGVWHFEQSYLPSMLAATSYDTICHEHLEYYSLTVLKQLVESEGLRVIDVETNSVNGGSIAVTVAPAESHFAANSVVIDWMLEQEDATGLGDPQTYQAFAAKVDQHRSSLRSLILGLRSSGKKIAGYGASTKGNVLLQYCGLGPSDLFAIGDVNPEKWGKTTPGSGIPIVSEAEMHAGNPDYLLVLPWHFREFILQKESSFLAAGGKVIFPLPEVQIVGF